MGLFKKLFNKKEDSIKTNSDFWNWFYSRQQDFFDAVKNQKNIEKEFFNHLSPNLKKINDGFFFLTGMVDDNTAELIITAEGNAKTIVWVEEFINDAPNLKNWKFTALKPPLDIENIVIRMEGYEFKADNIWFYSNDHPSYPDEIDITVIHNDLNQENEQIISNGTFIFLDNFLGELDFTTKIDNVKIIGKSDIKQELVPIAKLKNFINWREKEFIEKYEGFRRKTENDNFVALEAELENGNPLIAVINKDLLNWENKSSHPWIAMIEISFENAKNGMPDESTYQLLEIIEKEILEHLKDYDGYLNIGRQTADGIREIYFACKEFRLPSKVIYNIKKKYSNQIQFDYTIYKDKYWQSFNRFITH